MQRINKWLENGLFGSTFRMSRSYAYAYILCTCAIWLLGTAVVASLYTMLLPGVAVLICNASASVLGLSLLSFMTLRDNALNQNDVKSVAWALISFPFSLMLMIGGTLANELLKDRRPFRIDR